MTEAYLLLGSNLGDRLSKLEQATQLIISECGEVTKQSFVYETEAWGLKEQNPFLNKAVAIQTELSPGKLLTALKGIEQKMGRTDAIKWGPRLIDIDILLYGNSVIELAELKIPHPYLHERRFTLMPLHEIAGEVIHPVLQHSIQKLLEDCADKSEVKLFVR